MVYVYPQWPSGLLIIHSIEHHSVRKLHGKTGQLSVMVNRWRLIVKLVHSVELSCLAYQSNGNGLRSVMGQAWRFISY